ncbi:hypothetical protein FBU30_000093 [Linnemannia zychae]|nr:hypothetical protein FBU30_000093 [Linnemannia zychae]
MDPPSSDYMSILDLTQPRKTPLQVQLEKIDPSIIKNGVPTIRNYRKGPGRPKTDSGTALFEIECAEVLMELSKISVRPCSEQICRALSQASIQLQPTALQRTPIIPQLWHRVLKAWKTQYGIQHDERIDVENISAEYVNHVLLPQTTHAPQPAQQIPHQAPHAPPSVPSHPPHTPHTLVVSQPQAISHSQHGPVIPTIAIRPPLTPPYTHHHPNPVVTGQQHHIIQQLPEQQAPIHQQTNTLTNTSPHILAPENPSGSGSNPPQQHSNSNSNVAPASSASDTMDNILFRNQYSHLLTDPRRFHAPTSVLKRVHQFFKGSPHLDPASFDGTYLDCPISIPFPDIMDSDAWRVPIPDNNATSGDITNFAPVQSCFLHVPILPTKRRYETENEVVLVDDVRLAGQLNAKLWEEFSGGNVVEAITLIPTSATWFVKTELADWPCVVMSGLKFEQANGSDPSGKKYSEVHSYIAVYLGRDPLRQAQFVQLFQDLGISPPQVPENTLTGASSSYNTRQITQDGQHRWIAGFRRLFKTQGQNASRSKDSHWTPLQDDEDDIDPHFDDIYSILPPHKKPRLERIGRPSDGQAAWHHNKRRKKDEEGFSKVKDPPQNGQAYDSDAEMSE